MKTMKPKPRKHSPEQKVAMLRQHLIDHKPVSELCREHQLHPNVFYRQQKEFFEGGVAAFEKASSAQLSRLQRQIDTLDRRRGHESNNPMGGAALGSSPLILVARDPGNQLKAVGEKSDSR